MDELLTAAKFAVTGVLVGSAAATLIDVVNNAVLKAVNLPRGDQNDFAGQLGRQGFAVVVAASLGAAGILAGEKVMNKLVNGVDDPLFRIFYFNSAFLTSGTIMGATKNARGVFGQIVKKLTGQIPQTPVNPLPPGKGPVMDPAASCGKPSCGAH